MVWVPRKDKRDGYVDLVQRMLDAGVDAVVHVLERTSVNFNEYATGVPPTSGPLRELVGKPGFENGWVVVQCGYRVLSGHEVPMRILHYGDVMGSHTSELGRIPITIPSSALFRVLSLPPLADVPFTMSQAEKILEDESLGEVSTELSRAFDIIRQDMEEVFLRACGLKGSGGASLVQHEGEKRGQNYLLNRSDPFCILVCSVSI